MLQLLDALLPLGLEVAVARLCGGEILPCRRLVVAEEIDKAEAIEGIGPLVGVAADEVLLVGFDAGIILRHLETALGQRVVVDAELVG